MPRPTEPVKSTVTLFTPDPKQANTYPKIKISDAELPLVRKPKLGVYLDTFFSFNTHCVQVANRVSKRNIVAGTNWGQQKETLLLTYKALGISIANYTAPVWSTNASDTSLGKIQRTRNEALRIITGCIVSIERASTSRSLVRIPVSNESLYHATQKKNHGYSTSISVPTTRVLIRDGIDSDVDQHRGNVCSKAATTRGVVWETEVRCSLRTRNTSRVESNTTQYQRHESGCRDTSWTIRKCYIRP